MYRTVTSIHSSAFLKKDYGTYRFVYDFRGLNYHELDDGFGKANLLLKVFPQCRREILAYAEKTLTKTLQKSLTVRPSDCLRNIHVP